MILILLIIIIIQASKIANQGFYSLKNSVQDLCKIKFPCYSAGPKSVSTNDYPSAW